MLPCPSSRAEKSLSPAERGFSDITSSTRSENVESAEVVVSSSKEFDLTKEQDVERLFNSVQPDVVFHLAGLVGGILPNKERPAEFFYQNLMMGTFMLHYAWKHRVRKFVAAGAGCGYPEFAPIPLKETDFWSGFPQKKAPRIRWQKGS